MFERASRDSLVETMDAFLIPVFMSERNADGHWISLGHNARLKEFSGLELADVMGKRHDAFLTPEDAAIADENHLKCAQGRKPVHTIVNARYPSGQILLAVSLIPVVSADGHVRRIVGNQVGMTLKDGVGTSSLLDELTRLSAQSATTLFDALRAVELRSQSRDISPEEQRFLDVFHHLSGQALDYSLTLRNTLRAEARPVEAESHLIRDSALSRAIHDLT
ncbi:MAG: PAS domain-containing protein [Paracoccaceae bacterium]